MGLLIKPYEISLWRDEWDATKKTFLEKRMMTIGSDKMETQSRALEPKLIRKTNGEVTFSFKMYYLYIDNMTGEKVENLFTKYLTNETKIKLEYDNHLFHFLIKNIDKDSSAKTYTYSLVDQYVTELSKNGFDLVLDSTQMNNIGTSEELGNRILEGTGWTLESEKIVQTQEESLVTLKLPTNLTDYRIFRVNDSKTNLISQGATATELSSDDKEAMKGKLIYAFYSSCSGEEPLRFQFLYSSADFSTIKQNSDGLITEEGCQYYIDGLTYTIGVKEENAKGEDAWIVVPTNFVYTFPELTLGNNSPISMLYRGKRYVYNHESDFHVGLNQYVKKYQGSDGNRYYGYTKTHYVTPNCLQNLVTNSDFSGTAGWRGAKFIDTEQTEPGAYDYSSAIPLTVFNHSKPWTIWKNTILATDVYTWKLPYTFNATHVDDYPVGQNVYIDGTIQDQNDANIRIYGTVESQASVGTYGDYKITIAYHDVSIGYGLLNASINSIAVREMDDFDDGKLRLRTSLRDQLLGKFNEINEKKEYFSVLECGALAGGKGLKKVITNSGPYDIKNRLEGFTSGEKYIVEVELYHAKLNDDGDYVVSSERGNIKGYPSFRLRLSNFELKTEQDGYDFECWEDFGYDSNINGQKTLFSIQANAREDNDGFIKLVESEEGHYTLTQEVEMAATLSKTDFLKDNYTLFIEFPHTFSKDYWLIKKLRIYKKFLKTDGSFYTPDDAIDIDNSTYQEEQKYFLIQEGVDNRSEEEIEFLGENSGVIMTPLLTSDAERKSSINIKESNYFNAIQTLAETFECWPSIAISYSSDGEITKKIKLQNYVGQPNPIGFKYGLNSKNIKRTLDSKEIVSKLIVKANSNEYADHGFCTIAKAAANTTGDNVLYDFGHYIRQGLIDAQQLQTNLYVATAQELASLEDKLSGNTKLTTTDITSTIASALGYYPKLRKINITLAELERQMIDKSIPLSKAQSDYNTSKIGYDSTVADITEVKDNFAKTAGFSIDSAFTEAQQQQIERSSTLGGYLAQWTELVKQKQDFEAKQLKAESDLNNLENAYSLLTVKNNNAIALKRRLNQLFYLLYSSYIQEGTWVDESYTDENLYYNDALSVSANSAKPQVSYSINVISLAGIPEYSDIDFRVGDQTFIEDVEFFGQDSDGNPYQEQITITETQENLDDPSKNSIKVQNYENQFQDLFQRITATVQSVQYSEGDTNRARELANANTAFKISYLNDALTDASTVLSNAGNQTWRLDAEGLTLESENTKNKLRAVGGAILLGQKDKATGHDKWVTGITSEGVSANLITTGQLNTGLIQIMNGNQPTFRWDSHGITAYGFDNSSDDVILSGLDTQKGVRFDRFGIYGYADIDGEKWHPTTISGPSPVPTIDEKSTFSLTWEGLKVVSQKEGKPRTTLRIGDNAKVDDDDPAIFKVTKRVHDSATNQDIEEMQIEITDSGALRWGKGVGATQVLYAEPTIENKAPAKPQKAQATDPELFYDTFGDEATEGQPWHKIKTQNDKYSSITYDGGYTWEDPVQFKDIIPYSLVLSQDTDVIAISADGWHSKLPFIEAKAYFGGNEMKSPVIECEWDKSRTDIGAEYKDEDNTLTITHILAGAADIDFKFILTNGETEEGKKEILQTKTFTLKIVSSEVDYDLVVEQFVVNNTDADQTVTGYINVNRKGNKQKLTELSDFSVYVTGENSSILNPDGEFSVTFTKGTKASKTLNLKQTLADGDITWDTITITPVHNGAIGDSVYRLTLDNDMDMVARTPAGESVSVFPIITQAKAYYGKEEITTGDQVSIECDCLDSEVKSSSSWSYDSGSNTLSISEYIKDCQFQFKLYINEQLKDTETFTLKSITSDVDYCFLLDQTVFNNTDVESPIAIPIRVQKRSKDDHVTNLDETDGNVYVYVNNSDSPIENWANSITYTKSSTNITLALRQEIEGEWVDWDVETIEFIHNGSDVDLTYENMWTEFDKAARDEDGKPINGLITFGGNKLGLNADLINTGSINVGGTSAQDFKDAKFYADMKDGSAVYLSGWTVNKTSLTNGTIGVSGTEGIHIYSSGVSEAATIGNSGQKTDWRIAISNNFGVDSTGTLYAKGANFDDGTISGGTINIGGGKFIVTDGGDVTLAGGITWGAGASPTQAIYNTYTSTGQTPSQPPNNTPYSAFPYVTSTQYSGWHQLQDASVDYFASYTYDGGITWGPVIQIIGKDGTNGDTIQVKYAYCRGTTSTCPYTKPSGATLGVWSSSPRPLTSTFKYGFVTQCVVKNTTYGDWSDPVVWGRYGADGGKGSDATVNATNVFNALTSDKTKFGCFGQESGELYINANYINAGILSVGNEGSEIFYANINTKQVEIGGWDVTTNSITNGTLGTSGFHMYSQDDGTKNEGAFFGATSSQYWALGIGSNFGVTRNGTLYASAANITGTINASGGYIGSKESGFKISSNGFTLDNGTSALTWETHGYTKRIKTALGLSVGGNTYLGGALSCGAITSGSIDTRGSALTCGSIKGLVSGSINTDGDPLIFGPFSNDSSDFYLYCYRETVRQDGIVGSAKYHQITLPPGATVVRAMASPVNKSMTDSTISADFQLRYNVGETTVTIFYYPTDSNAPAVFDCWIIVKD